MAFIGTSLKIPYADSTLRTDEWINMNGKDASVVLTKKPISAVMNTMPELKGMGLKDVVYLCENMGLKINVKGKGKVSVQSIGAGQPIVRGQLLNIELD